MGSLFRKKKLAKNGAFTHASHSLPLISPPAFTPDLRKSKEDFHKLPQDIQVAWDDIRGKHTSDEKARKELVHSPVVQDKHTEALKHHQTHESHNWTRLINHRNAERHEESSGPSAIDPRLLDHNAEKDVTNTRVKHFDAVNDHHQKRKGWSLEDNPLESVHKLYDHVKGNDFKSHKHDHLLSNKFLYPKGRNAPTPGI